jgi:hypothetical protein
MALSTQHNDAQHNDAQHNDTQHNDAQHNDIHHNDTKQNDTLGYYNTELSGKAGFWFILYIYCINT